MEEENPRVPYRKSENNEAQIEALGEVMKISPRGVGSPQSVKFAVKKNPSTGQTEEVAAELNWYKCEFEECEGTPENPCGHSHGYCGPCAETHEKERPWFR